MSIIVSHLGLTARDVAMIKSVFNLNPQLREKFMFVELEQRRTSGRLADIIFVNADDAQMLEIWQSLAHNNKLTTPIMVTSSSEPFKDILTLQRPLVLKRLMTSLEEAISTSNKKLARGQSGNLSVLVVDDSFPVRKYMEHKLPDLTNTHLYIEFAGDGREAAEKMAQRQFDLVFLDVVMPGTDGYKVCKYIKSKYSSHVVMLTSKKSPFDKVRGSMSGCDAYITKPPQDEKLRKVLTTLSKKQRTATDVVLTSAGQPAG